METSELVSPQKVRKLRQKTALIVLWTRPNRPVEEWPYGLVNLGPSNFGSRLLGFFLVSYLLPITYNLIHALSLSLSLSPSPGIDSNE